MSEAEPNAFTQADAKGPGDAADPIDGAAQKRVEKRAVRFGAGLDPDVLRKLEDHLAKDHTLPVAKDGQTAPL